MIKRNDLVQAISHTLWAEVKSYNLPKVCVHYGLEDGDSSEAHSSKNKYVLSRLEEKDDAFILNLAKQLYNDYQALHLAKVLNAEKTFFNISSITRKTLLDALYEKGCIEGSRKLLDFLNNIWTLTNYGSSDLRYNNFQNEFIQHMVLNHDWTYDYLLEERLDILDISDEMFIAFVEQIVHPLVRIGEEQQAYIETINHHLKSDGYKIEVTSYISKIHPLYKIMRIQGGVSGNIKNIIFAADGPKPEMILSDSLNNDIQIVENEEFCLIYNKPIPPSGLTWNDLIIWWAEQYNTSPNKDAKRTLYFRLIKSLGVNSIEILLFKTYYSTFGKLLGNEVPALIPQVYLHYDPYTLRQLQGTKRIARQRMDFLFLFSQQERVVIEIDGQQHYSDGNKPSPSRYAEMVSEDRRLRLNGYEVYRFGGKEFENEQNAVDLLNSFFKDLLLKHNKLSQ